MIEIAKSFKENKKALSLKELDLSKCLIEEQHITVEFEEMIKSSLCTLKVLNLRDNFIKQTAAEQILDALKTNKSIVKIHMDYNPIKQQMIVEIDELCKRNRQIDEINQKNKNLIELKMKKMKAST